MKTLTNLRVSVLHGPCFCPPAQHTFSVLIHAVHTEVRGLKLKGGDKGAEKEHMWSDLPAMCMLPSLLP